MPSGEVTVEGYENGLETTAQATKHYFEGNGNAVDLGNKTRMALINSKDFKLHHNNIITGKTTLLIGDFNVNMEPIVYQIGHTNVDYVISVNSDGTYTVTYNLFVRDGFWDVDVVEENTLGKIPFVRDWTHTASDGKSPNLERLGGTPYPYKPVKGTAVFMNPGY